MKQNIKFNLLIIAFVSSMSLIGCNAGNSNAQTNAQNKSLSYTKSLKLQTKVIERPASHIEGFHRDREKEKYYKDNKEALIEQHGDIHKDFAETIDQHLSKLPIGILSDEYNTVLLTDYSDEFVNENVSPDQEITQLNGKKIKLNDKDNIIAYEYTIEDDGEKLHGVVVNSTKNFTSNADNRLQLYYAVGKSFFNYLEDQNYSQVNQDLVDALNSLSIIDGEIKEDIITNMSGDNVQFRELLELSAKGEVRLDTFNDNANKDNVRNMLANIFANYVEQNRNEYLAQNWGTMMNFMLEKVDIGQKIQFKKNTRPKPSIISLADERVLIDYFAQKNVVKIKITKPVEEETIPQSTIQEISKDNSYEYAYASIENIQSLEKDEEDEDEEYSNSHQETLMKTDKGIVNLVPYEMMDNFRLYYSYVKSKPPINTKYFVSDINLFTKKPDTKAVLPQSTSYDCITFGTLYSLELLANNAAQLNEYTLQLGIINNDMPMRGIFVPSPQVLKYSHSDLYNRIIEAFVRGSGEKEQVEHKRGTFTVQSLKWSIDNNKISGINPEDFKKFQQKWLTKYEQIKKDREFMNVKDSTQNEENIYIEFEADRLKKLAASIKDKNSAPTLFSKNY